MLLIFFVSSGQALGFNTAKTACPGMNFPSSCYTGPTTKCCNSITTIINHYSVTSKCICGKLQDANIPITHLNTCGQVSVAVTSCDAFVEINTDSNVGNFPEASQLSRSMSTTLEEAGNSPPLLKDPWPPPLKKCVEASPTTVTPEYSIGVGLFLNRPKLPINKEMGFPNLCNLELE